MLRHSGNADLPLHTGIVPRWLADRMMVLGTSIVESIILNYGTDEVLTRLSDPLWFQSFGSVLGMDWHSSGITTSVMYALKRGINPRAEELGLYVCGGRGKYSRQTPDELISIADKTGLDGNQLVLNSKLCAKVDNNAVQDGFQLYQHNFVISKSGKWTVIQQGMNAEEKKARRYHWCSSNLRSFVEMPHTGVIGENQGKILNLTDSNAGTTRNSIVELSNLSPDKVISELKQITSSPSQMIFLSNGKSVQIKNNSQPALFPEYNRLEDVIQIQETGRNLVMPDRHQLEARDVDLKRLGAVLATAWQSGPENFEQLLLTKNLGPRTLQSLTLVSEVIHGTSSRFTDPARFSFAHGGKDGHPFPVPLKIYDESIRILHQSIEKSKLGFNDKSECLNRLHLTALNIEKNCSPSADFDKTIQHELENSKVWDGKQV